MKPTDRSSTIKTAFSVPYVYSGTAFAGMPEYVDCADRGDTLVGICSDLAVCVSSGTTTSKVVRLHLGGSNIAEGANLELTNQYEGLGNGDCNVVAADEINLNETLAREVGYTGPYVTGTTLHSKEPLAFMMREDTQFNDFVNWVFRSLIAAEAQNITMESAHEFSTTTVFGEEYETMFIGAISAVGNYGELRDRAFGRFWSWENRKHCSHLQLNFFTLKQVSSLPPGFPNPVKLEESYL